MFIRPKITIVTVCYNAAPLLEKTIESVLSQRYPHIEYLIIDGNSTDNTKKIVEKYQKKIDLFISEPDKGIYDAMNKGIRLAKGEYINFMNAGDFFYDKDTLLNAIKKAPPQAAMIVGDVQVLNGTYSEIHQVEDLNTDWRGLKFCHQSLLLKTELAKKQLFSGKYVTSDFEQVYEIIQKHKKINPTTPFPIFYTQEVMAVFRNDGFNTKHKIRVRWESFRIVSRHDKRLQTKFAFAKLIIWTYCVEGLRKILPSTAFEKLFRLKQGFLPDKRKKII
ncbi:glycosyltransferase family 2 protein [Hugenholtzia roseola]|uniref:glycosyltransferase family 2 protein n=1 Tax=Hugenholtzia roseola TaxID=1002 RepID=UPI000413EEA9|nr:glycosyltransferase family 2 protein [Hugenholtzia roseola]